MAIRSNHYEAAFEGYIRSIRVPCVAVDEAKRALFGDEGVKNPDFLLYPRLGPNLVVEVKGKKGKNSQGRRPWENWVTTDDLDGLARWQEMFGPGFRAILAFAYAEPLAEFGLPKGDGSYVFRNLAYRFWAVGLDDYVAHLRSRGPAWKAVAMARAAFRRRVRPLDEWLPMTIEAPKRPPTRQGARTMKTTLRTASLAFTLVLATFAASAPAQATKEAPAKEPTDGFFDVPARPPGEEAEPWGLPAYMVISAIGGLGVFALCKSARRS